MVKPTRLTPSVELVPDVVQMAMVWTSRPTWKQFWQVWSPNLQFLGSDSALQTIQPMGQWVGWRGSHCLFPSNTNLFCWPPLHVWELLGKEPHVPSHYSRVAWKYWVYVGGKSSYNPCIYVCIYIYIWLLIKIPLSRDGHSSWINILLSRNFRKLHHVGQQHLLWRFVHHLPNYARESRITSW